MVMVPEKILQLIPLLRSKPAALLAVCFSCWMNERGECSVSLREMRKATGLKSKTTVVRGIKELQEFGLKVERRVAGNVYQWAVFSRGEE